MTAAVDVAIIGAGPAGSTAAAALARRGLQVVLLDRDSFPRDKLCGEFFSYDAVPILEALGAAAFPGRIGAPPISRCRVFSGTSSREFELPRPAFGISRLALDAELLRLAREAGATVVEKAMVAKIEDESLEYLKEGEPHRLRSRAIIGAWGRWGRLDRALGRPFVADRVHRHFGFKRHYVSTSGLTDTIELHSFDRGYLGVSHVEEGRVNICGLVHHSRLSQLKGKWEHFSELLGAGNDLLRDRFTAGPPAGEFLSSEPVIFSGKRPVEGAVLLAGDAAGLLDPLTGNGMAMAMQSGLLVASYVPQYLVDRSTARYEEAYHQLFDARVRWSRRIAFMLSRPSLVAAAVALLPRASGRVLTRRTRATDSELAVLLTSAFPV